MSEPNDNPPPPPAPVDPVPAQQPSPYVAPPADAPPVPLAYSTGGGPPYMGPAPTSDDRTMAILAHVLGIMTSFVGPLIIWLVKKDTMPFVADQAKEALNFNITVAIALAALMILGFVTLGLGFLIAVPIMAIIGIAALVLIIIAAMKSNEGVRYRYPFTLRLVK